MHNFKTKPLRQPKTPVIAICLLFYAIGFYGYATQPLPEVPIFIPPVPTEIVAETTAYSELDSCHYENCIMASTKRAYIGAIACPRNIQLGTKVEIDGKIYTCEDRTAKRYDGRFDIFIGYGKASHDKALAYGKQLKSIIIK